MQIKDEAKLERDALIRIHIKRYEKLFEEHISKTLDDFIGEADFVKITQNSFNRFNK